jgi:toxin ParE1/3/4
MPKIVLDPCVADELWGIWCFIAQDNPDAADRFVEAAHETFQTLAAHPDLGRRRRFRSPRLHNIRSWRIAGFENYLIFYRGARDMEALFGEK